MNSETLRSTLNYFAGKMSMCWKQIPDGEYDEARANFLVDDLLLIIQEEIVEARNEQQVPHPPTRKKNRISHGLHVPRD